jgi:putative ABC transport system substrate-binding protein
MRRREFIALVTSTALGWPLAARAEQRPARLRVGVAGVQSRSFEGYLAFEKRMAELGYQNGENFVFDFVQARSNTLEGYGLAYRELASRNLDIIMASGPEFALKGAIEIAGTRPIVMIAIDFDPLALGYIESLARPGGNITGLFLEQPQLAAKRLQFLRDSFPSLSGATVFWDQISADQWRALERAAAGLLGFHVSDIYFRERPFDYERALSEAAPQDRGALIVLASPDFALDRKRLPAFALQHRMISVFYNRRYVDVGGLLSYGPSFTEMYRRAADYVDRIAKGTKPGDLPVEEPTKYELVVNLKTANALGITIPPSILVLADEVIE